MTRKRQGMVGPTRESLNRIERLERIRHQNREDYERIVRPTPEQEASQERKRRLENLRKDIEARRAYGWPIDNEPAELRGLEMEPVRPPSQLSREMRKWRRELKTETMIIAKQSLYLVAQVIAYVLVGWLAIRFLFWLFG